MTLHDLSSTCSMLEIGELDYGHIEKCKTKSDFLKVLKRDGNHLGSEDKCLIYNSADEDLNKLLPKLGFKKINSYMGNSGCRVKTFTMNITRSTMNTYNRL